jgi:hypothetical protein
LAIASGVFSNPWFSKKSANCCVASSQQSAVDDAIALFSGEETSSEQSREIWLVESASETINKLKDATQQLAMLKVFIYIQGV